MRFMAAVDWLDVRTLFNRTISDWQLEIGTGIPNGLYEDSLSTTTYAIDGIISKSCALLRLRLRTILVAVIGALGDSCIVCKGAEEDMSQPPCELQ
jgi:hypothetical protein